MEYNSKQRISEEILWQAKYPITYFMTAAFFGNFKSATGCQIKKYVCMTTIGH